MTLDALSLNFVPDALFPFERDIHLDDEGVRGDRFIVPHEIILRGKVICSSGAEVTSKKTYFESLAASATALSFGEFSTNLAAAFVSITFGETMHVLNVTLRLVPVSTAGLLE